MGRNEAYAVAITATIANGASVSNAILYAGFRSGIFIMPGTFTGTHIGFKVSPDGSTWTDLYTAANAIISITVGVSRAYPFPAEALAAKYVQLVSDGTEAAARSITCLLKS